MTAIAEFDYDTAFSRNIGWVTREEQQALRTKKVAIGGMGGVGGVHALTLARSGIGAFHIADADIFEVANFNRQVGATVATVGKSKVDTLASMITDINPDARVTTFSAIDDSNVDTYLDGVDLFIDGIDFFRPDARELVFSRCGARGIPQITAAPLGLSVAYITFMPGQMTFEELFGFAGQSHDERLLRFMVGLAPGALHLRALADASAFDLHAGRGASTGAACQLCAGVTAVEALKILTGRGEVRCAPWTHQFDPFSGRYRARRSHFGHKNPLFRLRVAVARKMLRRLQREVATP